MEGAGGSGGIVNGYPMTVRVGERVGAMTTAGSPTWDQAVRKLRAGLYPAS
jgi:hypothetical protein